MSETITKTITFECVTCPECDCLFAVQTAWAYQRRVMGMHNKGGYCPNGHWFVWGESELEKVKKQLASRQAQLDQANSAVRFQAEQRALAEADAAKERKAVARLKKRATCGACPVCNRSFPKLAAHMKTKHPDYAATDGGGR